MVIDETLLLQGQFAEVGMHNLESLKQRVNCAFELHAIPFKVSSTAPVLSRSKPLPQLETFCFLHADMEQEQEALVHKLEQLG